MSTAPCGHADAECVIGNFWTCKSCGGESVVKPKSPIELQGLSNLSIRQARIDQLNKKIDELQDRMCKPILNALPPPSDVGRIMQYKPRVGLDSALKIVAKQMFPKYRADIAPGKPKSEGALGDRTFFLDPVTGERGVAFRNKMYGGMDITAREMHRPETLVRCFEQLCKEFVGSVNRDIAAVAMHRGWGDRYAIQHLGELPHLVVDDGCVLRYSGPGELDRTEVRIRAFYVVVPQ